MANNASGPTLLGAWGRSWLAMELGVWFRLGKQMNAIGHLLFAKEGVAVRCGMPKAAVEELVRTLLKGGLTLAPDWCTQRGHHGHEPEHGHAHHHADHADYGERIITKCSAGLAVAMLLLLAHGFGVVGNVQAQSGKNSPPTLAPEILNRIDAAAPSAATVKPKQARRILVFWRCEGFFHGEGIAAANHAIASMGRKTRAYIADFSAEYNVFEPANLAKYDEVVLNNTTQLKLTQGAKRALLDFVRSGKGMVGIHAATDSFYEWPEGAAMLGGLFDGHPWGGDGTWAFKVDDPKHPLDQIWGGKGFKLQDEIYQFKAPYTRADRRVLISLDLSDRATGAVQNGLKRTDGDFAVAWIKRHGEGRVFYCSLGHAENVFQDARVLRFYLDGIQFALGDYEVNANPR